MHAHGPMHETQYMVPTNAMTATVRVISLCMLFVCVLSLGPCDPLVPEYCALPFPNSFFTRPNKDSNTGVQVNLTKASPPVDVIGRRTDPAQWNTMDGFSTFPSIITYFPDLSDINIPPHWNMAASLAENSPTVLLHVDSGEKIAHFAELDNAADLGRKALMIWPSQRLDASSRYIVALRDLRNKWGNLVSSSNAFTALRDKIPSTDPDVEQRRELFEDIFERLEGVGVKRTSLQLAWDFTTASMDCLIKRLVFMRDDAFARVGEDGPDYFIDGVENNVNSHIYRRISGIMSVPIYISSFLPGSHLVIDKTTDLPVYQGKADVTFTVLIPHSVANGSLSPWLLQYGHGLFGNQKEVESSYLETQANEYGYVLFACNWWGMDEDDVPAIALMMGTDLGDFRIIPDRLTQGVVNAHLLMRLMMGKLSQSSVLTLDGKIKINKEHAAYYGNSLGGILGEVYMASTTAIRKGVIGVGGGPFGILLPRSVDFTPFEVSLRILYPDPVDWTIILAFASMLWSRLEPNAYMSSITHNPLPGTPTHRVLYHYALGDAQVNIIGLYNIARSSAAVMFESNVQCQFVNGTKVVTEELFGFPLLSDDEVVTNKSVAVGFDCGAPPEPAKNVPPSQAHDTHEGPRRSPLAHKQIDEFLRTGQIRNVCKGKCKCTL